MNFKFKVTTKHLLFVKLEKKGIVEKVTAGRWHQPCVHFQPQTQIKAIISKWLMHTSFHIAHLDGE